jgi:hypothetical protein
MVLTRANGYRPALFLFVEVIQEIQFCMCSVRSRKYHQAEKIIFNTDPRDMLGRRF